MTGLRLQGSVEDSGSVALAAAVGALLVCLGFAAASACRTRSDAANDRTRLVLLSLAAGAVLGTANLVANWGIAAVHPSLRALLVERFARIGVLQAVIAAPLVEEVTVRLFLMSVIAWLVFRLTNRRTAAFAFALVGSALFFGSLHLSRPLPLDPVLANYYRVALTAKYTLAGVALGWIFWRWGLPYAMLSHAAANASHMVLEKSLF